MSEQQESTATPVPETLEPLTAIEAALVAHVGDWRESERRRLEVAWQRVMSQSNERIAPVLRAHALQPGDEWDIRQDEASVTGWALAIKKGALAPAGTLPAPELPINRTARRRLNKEISKAVRKPIARGKR